MSYKSLTINERYNILKEFGKIEKENTDALIQWRNDMSLLSQKQFQKMLQYNQYDKKIFSYAVTREPDENIVKLYEKSEVEHIWRCTYWEILNTNILYEEKSYWGQDEGFNYIVRHFVKYVEKQLIESLEGIKFTKDCLDGILRQFTLKLVDLGNKAMIMELNHLKESQNLKGDTSAERFKYFISLFENMEFLKSFYEKYSVLARLYTELSILFINNIKEIWDFIKNDKEILKEEFGIVDGEFVLNKVAIGIGDTHNFGKTVKKYLFLGESLLNKIKENIHDVESMSWCRGNVGLALGLLKIQNIIAADRENDMIQEMVDEIHTKICNSNKMKNDCICHGNLSVAEYFIFRYQIFKDEKDLKIATKIVNMVKDRQTFRSLPEIPGFGIFTGEGGLAYELLRLEKCEEVPTLLC